MIIFLCAREGTVWNVDTNSIELLLITSLLVSSSCPFTTKQSNECKAGNDYSQSSDHDCSPHLP